MAKKKLNTWRNFSPASAAKLSERNEQKMIKAVGFDYGNTLTDSGMPLNWQQFHPEALTAALAATDSGINQDKLGAGEKILFKYNTRVNNRDWEVTSDTVFKELFAAWGIADISLLKPAKDAFYSFFFTKTQVYPETESVLKELKKKNIKIGVLSNTAYGADKEYLIAAPRKSTGIFDCCLARWRSVSGNRTPPGFSNCSRRCRCKQEIVFLSGMKPVDVIGGTKRA